MSKLGCHSTPRGNIVYTMLKPNSSIILISRFIYPPIHLYLSFFRAIDIARYTRNAVLNHAGTVLRKCHDCYTATSRCLRTVPSTRRRGCFDCQGWPGRVRSNASWVPSARCVCLAPTPGLDQCKVWRQHWPPTTDDERWWSTCDQHGPCLVPPQPPVQHHQVYINMSPFACDRWITYTIESQRQ